ncbi:MAG: hypothetical protein SPD81_11735, partial [Candidatus Faecousia sp.]|nr:hypothetical protein [Candidatus Faecousia sp.]
DYAPTSKAACAYKRFAVELDQKLSLEQSTSAPASHSTQVRVFIAKKGYAIIHGDEFSCLE